MRKKLNRRDFLKTSSIVTGGMVLGASSISAESYRRILGANERINFIDSPFYVNTELKGWETESGIPRRAAISSFGFSGTNCHLVIEEAPRKEKAINVDLKPYYLIPVSGKTTKAGVRVLL